MADGQFDEATIRAALNTFLDPETGQSVMQTGQVRDIAVDSGKLSLTLALTTHSAPLWDATKQQLENHLRVKLNRFFQEIHGPKYLRSRLKVEHQKL